MITVVQLSSLDRMVCGLVGLSRNSSAIDRGMKLESGRKDFGIEAHVIGAMAEFAVARALGINWHPITGATDTKRGDVGNIQVKSIKQRNHSLIVRTQDPGQLRYVVCLVSPTSVELLGWIEGADAKTYRYWREVNLDSGIHQAAYFVPVNALSKMSEF